MIFLEQVIQNIATLILSGVHRTLLGDVGVVKGKRKFVLISYNSGVSTPPSTPSSRTSQLTLFDFSLFKMANPKSKSAHFIWRALGMKIARTEK